MAQLKVPKDVYEGLSAFVTANDSNGSVEVALRDCILDGLKLIEAVDKDDFVSLNHLIERSFPGKTDVIIYTDIPDIGSKFNEIRLPYRIKNRRRMIYEAIVQFCLAKKILELRDNELVFNT